MMTLNRFRVILIILRDINGFNLVMQNVIMHRVDLCFRIFNK